MMFSVIVPIYNVEKYLPQCIESVLNQTFKDFELLLIDDGSPDNSGFICDDYAKKDTRIKVIHKRNEGVSIARNMGLQLATGKYIWFLDSDDFMVNFAMQNVMDYIKNQQNDVDMVTCSHYNNFSDGKLEIKYLPFSSSSKPMNRNNYYQNLYFSGGAYWAPWKNIYKRSIIDNNKLLFAADVICAEDCDFFMRFIECASNYSFFNEPVVHYRVDREGSVTNTMSRKAIEDRLSIYAKYYYKFCKNTSTSTQYMKNFFANKYANGLSELYRLKDGEDKENLNSFIGSHRKILKDTKGFKYTIAKFIWGLFGYYKGSKILSQINPKSW